ncbi:MAG: transcriptional initiation protein Tat, partial [Planctomycetes bacterium]|nr:transcriptional initiation protein Tat [Planctomycetota bacterium]
TSADATTWQTAEQAQAAYEATASHGFEADTTDALSDGLLPKHSNDQDIPRFTWWPQKGTTEWVAYRFPKPRTITWTDVYWFDDTGGGGCRVPASWRLLVKDGAEWKPVTLAAGSSHATAKDAFNKAAFEPVTAQEVRLEVKLQDGFSGGILEWRVGPPAK